MLIDLTNSSLKKVATAIHPVAIIPALDVLLTKLTLPKLNRQRLLQAIPYALEEQLMDDIDNLHFAVDAYQPDNTVPVAIIAKEKMLYWINLLNSQTITPTQLLPLTLALPYSETIWHIVIRDNVATVRTDSFGGFACDLPNLNLMLDLKLNEAAQKPQQIVIYNYSDMACSFQHHTIKILEKRLPDEQFLNDLQNWLEKPTHFNLLQGVYSPKYKAAQIQKVWLVAGACALAWIFLGFSNHFLSLLILNYKKHQLESSIQHIYYKHFPQATSVVAPKERMLQKLKELNSNTARNHLLLWLAYLSKSRSQVPEIHIQNLNFQQNQMILAISAPNFELLDEFIQSLSLQGLTIKQQNASTVGSQVKTEILLSQENL